MRHIGSLIAAIVVAPVAWLLIALGQAQSGTTVTGWVREGTFDTTDLIRPACLLAGAGLLVGLIATLRTSPLGALVAGLCYAGSYLALFAAPLRVHSAVPGKLDWFGQTIRPRLPLENGTLLILGLLLLTAVVSVQRWRSRRPATEAAGADTVSGDERGVDSTVADTTGNLPSWQSGTTGTGLPSGFGSPAAPGTSPGFGSPPSAPGTQPGFGGSPGFGGAPGTFPGGTPPESNRPNQG